MRTRNRLHRHGIGALAAAIVALQAVAVPQAIHAQNAAAATFELRPFCQELSDLRGPPPPGGGGGGFAGEIPDIPGIINPGQGSLGGQRPNCKTFQVHSPSMMRTDALKQGDTLDLHLVLNNPQRLPVSRVRAWLVYDPSILRGDMLELGKAFPVPTPGEAEFAATDGYAKIGASAAQDKQPSEDPLVVAHVKFTVLATPYSSTVVSFYDAQGSADGHTFAMTTSGDERDILTPSLPSLLVQLQQESTETAALSVPSSSSSSAAPAPTPVPESSSAPATSSSIMASIEPSSSSLSSSSTASSEPAVATSSDSSASSALPPPSAPSPTFGLLQPQNLRVTSEADCAYLAWDPLPSSELAGYNIYYGTVSGNYMQRRSVDRSVTNLKLCGLPAGKTYYFALRGANAQLSETQFGQEVAVTIGNPATSTAPLSASVFTRPGPQGRPPATGGAIGGETGVPSLLMLFLVGSAVVGTLLAFRHQWTARASS